jgi:hypothetical protein
MVKLPKKGGPSQTACFEPRLRKVNLSQSSSAFETGTMHVRRAKGGQDATHPLLGDELRALRELKRQAASPFVFASEHVLDLRSKKGDPSFSSSKRLKYLGH